VALALAAASGFGFAPSRAVAPPRARPLRAEGDDAVEAAPEEAVEAVEAVAAEAPAAEEAAAAADVPAEEKPSAIARQKRKDKANATPLDQLVVGESYPGTITGVAQYGAFVDVGAAADGLVHISELSTEYVEEVSAVATVGDAVTVRVLKLDLEKKQLSLSMKPKDAPPPAAKRGGRGGGRPRKAGADELRKYADADPAEFVDGVVRTVLPWGAFVNIAEGVDGLVHVSRVADGRVDDLEARLSVGDEVKVRVVGVDLDKATVALAMNTYRDPTAPPRPGERDDGPRENARARRARDPDQKGRGGQRRPSRRDPGDDIWDSKDSYDWKDVVQTVEYDEDDLASGISVDLETGKLTLQ